MSQAVESNNDPASAGERPQASPAPPPKKIQLMNGININITRNGSGAISNINITSSHTSEVLRLLRLISERQGIELALIDDLATDVADESTVVDSAVQLLANLSAQLAAAGTDPVKLAAIKTAIDANKQKLADAVAANTVAAPPTA